MRRLLSIVAAGLALAGSTPAFAVDKAIAQHVYGPEPDWATFRQLAEQAVAATLYDPESARFRWRSGIFKGHYKQVLGPKLFGWTACGTVNAKNRIVGYVGARMFAVLVDNGRALAVDANPPYSDDGQKCVIAVAKGILPPLPATFAAADATSGGPAAIEPVMPSPFGLAVRAMPDGAYVSAVVPGSPATSAGIKAGMVIAGVNAIPLAGMGEAMRKVVDAASAGGTLAIVGGATFRLESPK